MNKMIGFLFLAISIWYGPSIPASEIHERVKAGDLPGLKVLLETNPKAVSEPDESGMTALHWAARGTNLEMIALLVEKGADFNALSRSGIAPLHSLATRGNTAGARILLAKGAQVDLQMADHQTALYLATLEKQPEMVRLLVEFKADLEHRDDYGRTPLVLAAREMAGVEMVRLLLDLGAQINAADRWQDTALTLAAWRGSADVVELLLELKAPIPTGEKGAELLQSAVEKGLMTLFSQLMAQNVDIPAVGENGRSLLHAAAEGGSLAIIEALVGKGLAVNQADNNGWTPLHFAADMGRSEAINLLVAKGANLQARTLMGQTAANLAQDNRDQATLAQLETKGLKATPALFPKLIGPYLGQKSPGRVAEVFAPGIVSARWGLHSSVVFSTDGREALWRVMIPPQGVGYSDDRTLISRLENGRWTYPTDAVFSGVRLEDVPFYHPDGSALYDMARRSFPDGKNTAKENIWIWTRGQKGWQKPHPLPTEVNDYTDHWQFSLDLQGNLYFSATRAGGQGADDIYQCRYVNGQYLKAENLGPLINSPAAEKFPFIAPDGLTLLFVRSYNIYACFKDPAGNWSRPRPLGPEVNTPEMELMPIVSPDGKYLFFGRSQRQYWISASIIDDLRRIETARFSQKSAAVELESLLAAGNLSEAKMRFQAMRVAESKDFFIDEAEFNALGYRFVSQRNLPAAVMVMELGTVAFPDSWNAWDSLGEALMASGQNDRAERAYEKSLSLNPESQSGRENLRILRRNRQEAAALIDVPPASPFLDAGSPTMVPAELAWLTAFASRAELNPQGRWQLTLAEGIEMVYIPAAEFSMGSKSYEVEVEAGEMPVHRVWVKGILMGRTEVTRDLWQAVMRGKAPAKDDEMLPVTGVTYANIEAFLQALRLKTGLGFRLPTEAEWEKGCRAGTVGEHYGPLDKIAWYADNSGMKPHPVGGKAPNAYGLYDMLGNVWEWCSDWNSETYYRQSPYVDPTGPATGERKVCRGGGFRHRGRYLRAAHRNDMRPDEGRPYHGFRLALDIELR